MRSARRRASSAARRAAAASSKSRAVSSATHASSANCCASATWRGDGGNTDRQAKAIHDAIHKALKDDHGLLPRRVEGAAEGRWILMDYLDVVVHVFTPDAREFYRLEQLWGEAPKRAVG